MVSGSVTVGETILEKADGLAIEYLDQSIELICDKDTTFFFFPAYSFLMMQDSLILEQPGEIKLPDAELFFYPQLLESNQADILLASLRQEIEWTQNTIRFYGKESLVPRLEAWYGDPGKSYSYSGIHMNPKPWTQNLIQIKKAIEPIAKVTFNSVLINYYRDGKDRVAWHSDDEKELGQNPVIGSISLGAERKFKNAAQAIQNQWFEI